MAGYKIIGNDGKQYGPVSETDLRKWIAEGRANRQTKAQAEGAAEWKALSDFPEFEAAFQGAPPPLSAGGTATPVKTSAMAVTSLVLGILGMFTCGLTALVGLILGIVAMVKVKNSGGRVGGNGIAIAGVIVSGVFLIMIPLYSALMLPALAQAKQKAETISCASNEKQLAIAVRLYSDNSTNRFPPAATWCDAIKTSAGSEAVFKCPAANPGSRCSYAFNVKLDGMDLDKVNPRTVMIFESDGGWNANGGPELIPVRGRHAHGRMFNVAFVDGHVESVTQSRLNTLRWDP